MLFFRCNLAVWLLLTKILGASKGVGMMHPRDVLFFLVIGLVLNNFTEIYIIRRSQTGSAGY